MTQGVECINSNAAAIEAAVRMKELDVDLCPYAMAKDWRVY
jgi:hypothetical protein